MLIMILYLDTETTSLRPGNICQLSYVMQNKKGTTCKNYFFSVDYVEPSAYMVHHFSVEKLRELSLGKTFRDCIEEIEKDFLSAKLIVSHNTAFDFMFLRREFELENKIFTCLNDFCSMKKFTPVLKLKRTNSSGYKYPKLSELTAYFNITEKEISKKTQELFNEELLFHDARYDTTAVYLALNRAMDSVEQFKNLKELID